MAVISTATDQMTATIGVGNVVPNAFGLFIQPAKPAPKFVGIPGQSNCIGVSVAALVGQHGGLNAAAAALGYPSAQALQHAIMAFCEA
jgi:hypothetical protein